MPANKQFESKHLLSLLGQQVVCRQQQCEIIELLDDCEFVLQVLATADTNIQSTQYGEGHRDVPVTYILSIFDGEGELHSDLIASGIDLLLTK
ncbi:MAG: hypothetical protein COA90_00710 [Gammaproteobacteria bacterium]|nr:MAG: hypothetical protein COA90_00710 [Gammaproteobacteria bacterium]